METANSCPCPLWSSFHLLGFCTRVACGKARHPAYSPGGLSLSRIFWAMKWWRQSKGSLATAAHPLRSNELHGTVRLRRAWRVVLGLAELGLENFHIYLNRPQSNMGSAWESWLLLPPLLSLSFFLWIFFLLLSLPEMYSYRSARSWGIWTAPPAGGPLKKECQSFVSLDPLPRPSSW